MTYIIIYNTMIINLQHPPKSWYFVRDSDPDSEQIIRKLRTIENGRYLFYLISLSCEY